MKWISTAFLLAAASAGLPASQATAQQYAPPPYVGQQTNGGAPYDELSARLEQQNREIQQLQAQINGLQSQGINATNVSMATPADADAKKAADQAKKDAEGYVVGSDMNVKTTFFKDGSFLNFETANKDFTMHLGGWVQWDNVWFTTPTAMKAAQGKAFQGAAPGGIGTADSSGKTFGLQDGESFRRVRIVMEGTSWETFEYRFNFAFENDQFSTTGLDEFWVGDNRLPVIGTVRAGHFKAPMGLEADMVSSSRAMTFLERSNYSEAIELNQNFVTGLWFGNSYADDHMTSAFALFRPDQGSSGDFYGTNQLGVQGRLTGLAFYEDEGRHLLHFGISSGWRNGSNNIASTTYTGNTVTLQSRPEFRDDDPAAGGNGALPNTDSNRMVSTGPIACTNEYLMGLETLYIHGPFSFQAEYGWNWLGNARAVMSTSTPTTPALAPVANYMFDGGYVQVSYMLTGENGAYDKKGGCLSRYYLGSKGPAENAFLVRDENGCWCSGKGAWEVAARYSYTDLNAGSGASRINGGLLGGTAIGLNWYLNSNLTINNEFMYDNRWDVPGATVASYVRGFGTRMQFSF